MTSTSHFTKIEEEAPATENPNPDSDDEYQCKLHQQLPLIQLLDDDDDDSSDDEQQQQPFVMKKQESGMSSLSDFTSKTDDLLEVDPPHLASPSYYSRRANTRKKGGGVGARKKKQLQALERKFQAKSQELLGNLKPIPFTPDKILDFSKQENLIKRLGLWDFAHMQFDRDIRVDLIAQLIVSYDSKSRCGYVNGKRVKVNRSDLARALKLPVKKEKGASTASSTEPVDLDSELPGDETLTFFDDFISNWILLHDDTWIMPLEVLNWTKVIKEGHFEKFDWAGMIWFMVEKELLEGVKLEQCYYASHLQHLIKSQREDLFFSDSEGGEEEVEVKEEEVKEEVEGEEVKEEVEGEDVKEEVEGEEVMEEVEGEEVKEEVELDEVKKDNQDQDQDQEQANIWMEEPNVELTLGQDNVEREENKDDEMEENEKLEQGKWLLDGKNDMDEHFLQRCDMEVDRDMDNIEWKEEEYEEEEEEEEEQYEEVKEDFEKEGIEADDDDEYDERFSVPSSDDDPLENHENLLQGLDTTQLPFSSALGQLDDHSNMELLEPPSTSRTHPLSMAPTSVFGHNRKREIDHESDIANGGSNKRLRNEDNSHWGGGHVQHQHHLLHQQTSSDFGMCLDQLQHWIGKAKMMYEEKEQASEQSNVNEQYLVNELQNRDQIIEHLQRTKSEEIQKKENEIYRLEREMCIMGNLLEGYRKSLKETHKSFAQYRKHNQLPEEKIYRDAGPRGLVLSTMEMEKIRLREEEENRVKRVMIEHQFNEITQVAISELGLHFNQLQALDNRLVGIDTEVKLLKDVSAKNKEREMEREEQGHEMEVDDKEEKEKEQGDDEGEKKEKEAVDDEEEEKKEPVDDEEEEKKEPVDGEEEEKKEAVDGEEEEKKEPVDGEEEEKKEAVDDEEEEKKEPVDDEEEKKQEQGVDEEEKKKDEEEKKKDEDI